MTDIPERLAAALAGRYTIRREIGAGGMATVYLAQDLRHERDVAVKVLRPELAATLGPDRFQREIQIAAKLQHPHILPLLDSGQADGFLYYVMPFVEGESLRDRLIRMRELPIYEATRLLRDVADALSHAHARGVVHRDIKPENVMLTGRHALVTDFGVAKAVSEAKGSANLTTAGVALGTPSYMSPEQAAADPTVDHRADIYALGAMGYELLAGRPPFVGTTPQQLLAMHVTQEPDALSRYRPGVPAALEAVIMRCLAKRAADRWQSAEEVVERLEALGTMSSGSVTPTQTQPTRAVAMPGEWYGHPLRVAGLFLLASMAVLGAVYFLTIQLGLPDWVPWAALGLLAVGLPIMVITGLVERKRAKLQATGMWSVSGETGLHQHVTWKKATRGGMLAFGGLALAAVVYTAMRLLGIGPVGTLVASGKLSERDKIVVADFANSTSDSTLGASISEAFRIDLAQSPVMSIMTSSALTGAMERMGRDPRLPLDAATARELAQREGAKAVVAAEISPVGRSFVLTARLLSAGDGAELVAIRETAADDGQILAALDRLSRQLRERVGESLRSIRADEPLEHVTTASLEALRLYSEGVKASNNNENDKAAELLRQAVKVDSGFAMAWRKLAVVIRNSQGSPTEALDAATRAYQHRERLPEIERYVTTAYYFDAVDYDPSKVEAAYRAVLAIDPDNVMALNNLGNVYEVDRRFAEAETLYAHAARVGSFVGHREGILRAQTAQGKYDEARATLADMAKAFPTSSSPKYDQAAFEFATGSWDTARQMASRLRVAARTPEERGAASALAAAGEQLTGHLRLAEQNYRDLVAVSEARGLRGTALGSMLDLAGMRLMILGDTAGAHRLVDSAVARYPMASMPAVERPYTGLALLYASLGQAPRARQVMREYETAVPEGVRRGEFSGFMADGYIALAEGRYDDARRSFRTWSEQSGCVVCGTLETGRILERAGKPDSAITVYETGTSKVRDLYSVQGDRWYLAPNLERLGALYEETGQKRKAIDAYSRFVDLWKDADPELQPRVRAAKTAIAKLAGEGR